MLPPLPERMRPQNLSEYVGQRHLVGPGCILRTMLDSGALSSFILWGPPGVGKTTLARIIAHTLDREFYTLSAVSSGVKDVREVIDAAKGKSLFSPSGAPILFIDEIHRFNKAQQDYLLPFVEDGTVILIGATTENPYFEVNPALLSRSTIFELKPLTKEQISELLERAMKDPDRGLGSYRAELTDDARDFLADVAGGDARTALNALELAVMTTGRGEDGRLRIDLAVAEDCIQKRAVHYDKNGDQHYDTISAFIKSMRGSDPDAAVYYLAKMLEAGEDIRFIARRMMICASEDVGNADPQALTIAVSAAQAVERVGMPESQLILAHAAIYIACAPKSNSVTNAIFAATQSVREKKTTVPVHLQDAHYSGHDDLGHGIGYRYAHNYPKHYVKQQYLPDELAGEHFYEPGELGYEAEIRRHFAFLAEEGQQTQGNAEE